MPEIKDEIKKRPNKQALLKDLELIRESLSDEDDIPILTDSIIGDDDDADDADEEVDPHVFDETRIFDDVETFGHDEDDADSMEYADEDLGEVSEEEILRAAYRDSLSQDSERANLLARQALEGQQSLFDDLNQTGIRESLDLSKVKQDFALPMATGENPFLPKHIRDRLTQGKNSFLEEIALVNESLKRGPSRTNDSKPEIRAPHTQHKSQGSSSHNQKADYQKADYQKVVDELVKEFLPQLESALRKRLTQILNEKEK